MLHEGTSSAPSRCKSYSYDANQQALSLTAWEQRYDQHSSGHFWGYLDEFKAPRLHVFEEVTNRSLIQQCCVHPNAIWIGFSLQPQRPRIDGLAVERSQVMLRPAQQEFELLTPESFQIFGLVIDQALLEHRLSEADFSAWQVAKILNDENTQQGCWRLVDLIHQLLNRDSIVNQRLAGSDWGQFESLIENSVLDRLSEFFVPAHSSNTNASSRRSALKRIQHYIENSGRYPQSINELSQIACVSRRTLQYVFEQELNSTPITYLRECRLNQIRRSLIHAEEGLSVSDLALKHGFFHMGSFHHYYKVLFGETPNQTRLRAQGYRRQLVNIRSAVHQHDDDK